MKKRINDTLIIAAAKRSIRFAVFSNSAFEKTIEAIYLKLIL
ncbi:MAG: hypothetical protein ACI4SF_03440 [Oscillospiraceae bacterium]